jgi:hypothetical protein
MRRKNSGMWDEYDSCPDTVGVGTNRNRAGWKYDGLQDSPSGLMAVFRYSVEVFSQGSYREDHERSAASMTPNRLAYTLPQLEGLKAEKLFIISVPEKVMDQGIMSLKERIAAESAKAVDHQIEENQAAQQQELVLKVA